MFRTETLTARFCRGRINDVLDGAIVNVVGFSWLRNGAANARAFGGIVDHNSEVMWPLECLGPSIHTWQGAMLILATNR
jgi:hypothetical protein